MSQFPQSQRRPAYPLDYSGAGDLAVASFFNAVYAWMAVGLALTGVVAWYVSQNVAILNSIRGGGFLILFLVEIGLVIAITSAINRISAPVATLMFMLYSALNGVLLSFIFKVYTNASIGSTFMVTAGAFAATSIYGYVTKKDLTAVGSLLFMALIGLVIASVVNIFWHNPMFYYLISYAGVIIFVGLTAYDTQKLKQLAYQTSGNQAMAARMSIVGSLVLYLDFINLFLFLLRIMGDRRK